jgi:hypothetical protein
VVLPVLGALDRMACRFERQVCPGVL